MVNEDLYGMLWYPWYNMLQPKISLIYLTAQLSHVACKTHRWPWARRHPAWASNLQHVWASRFTQGQCNQECWSAKLCHDEPSACPSSLWLPASTCLGESCCSPCSQTAMLHLLSPASTVSTSEQNSHTAAQIHPAPQTLSGRKGSNVYALNLWLWQLTSGRPLQCLHGGRSVADTEDRQTELQADGHLRAVETLKPCTAQKAAKWPDIKESRVCKDIQCLFHKDRLWISWICSDQD